MASRRPAWPSGVRRRVVVAGAAAATGTLAGCSGQDVEQWRRGGLPPGASDRTPDILSLWVGSWIAALLVGLLVWGLILWAVFRYRRRTPEPPAQTRYHLPIEVLYTVVPFIIVAVLFVFTVDTQHRVLQRCSSPDRNVNVVGQKWAWTFNYLERSNPDVGAVVHETGTIERPSTLWLPVGDCVRFHLDSEDVVHSFWVPEFYFKMDVIPGRTNTFDATPDAVGTFAGRCAELCGTYHSHMLFTLKVVPQDRYIEHLQDLRAAGQTGRLTGNAAEQTQAGLEDGGEQ